MDDDDSPSVALNGQCEMCSNYEVSLQSMQTEQDTLREQFAAAKELYEKYGKELSEERLYRKDAEARFAALNEETEQKIQICLQNVTGFEERLSLLGKKQEADLADMGRELDESKERQTALQNDLKALYEKYQRLLHKNSQKADEMREQCIELPQTIDELTLLTLQLREDLISEKAAREHECQELKDELTVGREQMLEMEISAKENEEQLMMYAQHTQQQQQQLEQKQREQRRRHQRHQQQSGGGGTTTSSAGQGQQLQSDSPSQLEQKALDLNEMHADCCSNENCQKVEIELDRRLNRSMDERARLQELLFEQRNKCSQMQNELDTSEAVQKDFVRLSQNLQVELEKIRQSECDVRWQEAEDISQCNNCGAEMSLDANCGKVNCRHCGKVFCLNCTSNKVPSGPSKRPVPVCSLCHMLLTNKDLSVVDRLNPSNNNPQ